MPELHDLAARTERAGFLAVRKLLGGYQPMPLAIELARRYAEALVVLRAVHDFDEWIGQYWQERCPAPVSAAAARNAVGDEDAIVWDEGLETVFGFLPGHDGCFCIPRDIALPNFSFAAGSPVPPFGQDIVISAGMREELQPPGT